MSINLIEDKHRSDDTTKWAENTHECDDTFFFVIDNSSNWNMNTSTLYYCICNIKDDDLTIEAWIVLISLVVLFDIPWTFLCQCQRMNCFKCVWLSIHIIDVHSIYLLSNSHAAFRSRTWDVILILSLSIRYRWNCNFLLAIAFFLWRLKLSGC